MTDPQRPKSKFAVSDGPVNRRTVASAQRAEPPPPTPLVRSRLHAAQAKHRLGAPLTHRLSNGSHTASASAIHGSVIALTVACSMSGVGLFVAALQGAWPWAGICASALVGLGAWAWRTQRRRHARTAALEVRLQALVAASDLQQLDALLEQVAKESRAATVEQLVGFKESLVRCVGLTTTHEEQGLLASEDGLFVRETVRRYAPDSLQAFLKVPRAERGTQEIEAGKTALTLLEEQIGLLTQQLNVREARLGQISGEALLQQQRFLAAKTTSSHL